MSMLQILLKTTGSLMALAGCCGCGIWLTARRRRRLEILREMEQILIFLYGEIEYAAVDVAELFLILAEKMCYFKSFFEELCWQFDGIEQETLYELWKKTITGCGLADGVDKEDVELWQEVGMQLGTLERKTQLQTLQILRERLHRRIIDAEAEYKAQARVYRLTGVTGGIFMVILLL